MFVKSNVGYKYEFYEVRVVRIIIVKVVGWIIGIVILNKYLVLIVLLIIVIFLILFGIVLKVFLNIKVLKIEVINGKVIMVIVFIKFLSMLNWLFKEIIILYWLNNKVILGSISSEMKKFYIIFLFFYFLSEKVYL